MYSYNYPHPAVTVDVAVFTRQNNQLKLLLIQRAIDPHKGKWALPGGFVDIDEDLETAARRELKEETGLQIYEIHQLKAFGNPGRDPRGRTISIAFWGEVFSEEKVSGSDDAADAQWFDLENLPPLAFDHELILKEFMKQNYV